MNARTLFDDVRAGRLTFDEVRRWFGHEVGLRDASCPFLTPAQGRTVCTLTGELNPQCSACPYAEKGE